MGFVDMLPKEENYLLMASHNASSQFHVKLPICDRMMLGS